MQCISNKKEAPYYRGLCIKKYNNVLLSYKLVYNSTGTRSIIKPE